MKTFFKTKLRQFAKQSAERMNKKAAHYSVNQQKLGLLVFCSLFSIISISIMIESGSSKNNDADVFAPLIHAPGHIGKSFLSPFPFVSKETYDRIEDFKTKLDSIALRERPLLLDSIKRFEQLYLSQTKK